MLVVSSTRLGVDSDGDGGHEKGETTMTCLKCQGLAIPVVFFDGFNRCELAKCLNCGLQIDRVWIQNRLHRPERGHLYRPRPREKKLVAHDSR